MSPANKVISVHTRMLIIFLAVRGSAAPSPEDLTPTRRCSEGLLHGPERKSPEVPLMAFLSFSLTPMMDIKKDCSVQLMFRDRYHRAVYLLEVDLTLEVGCWLSLRHVPSYELITKVLWPVGVLQGFEKTLLTVVLNSGILRVTAITLHGSLTSDIHHHQNLSRDSRLGSMNTYYSGPYLLLTSLRKLHESWEDPVTVQLLLPPRVAPVHYTMNCNTDDLQWAWMQALKVREDSLAWAVPWLVVALLASALVLLLVLWCCLPGFSKARRKVGCRVDSAPAAGDQHSVPSLDANGTQMKENSFSSSAFTNYAYLFN
ncbi:hypothetical protein FHG87_014533 [Trinorchestia longiramus]|nr:hypothetical protein FHG87_014533 [Trinorchestia longiramus]